MTFWSSITHLAVEVKVTLKRLKLSECACPWDFLRSKRHDFANKKGRFKNL